MYCCCVAGGIGALCGGCCVVWFLCGVAVGFSVGSVEWAQESEVGIVYCSDVVVSASAILGGGGVRVSEAR